MRLYPSACRFFRGTQRQCPLSCFSAIGRSGGATEDRHDACMAELSSSGDGGACALSTVYLWQQQTASRLEAGAGEGEGGLQ